METGANKIWLNAGRTQWLFGDGTIRERRLWLDDLQTQWIDRRGVVHTTMSTYAPLSDRNRWRVLRQYSSGSFTLAQLAYEYEVSVGMVWHIVSGKGWPFIKTTKQSRRYER
jgi:hypothetical protein